MKILICLAGAVLATGCSRMSVSPAPAAVVMDTISIDGSPALLPLLNALAREYRTVHPAAPVKIGVGLGSRERIEAVVQGKIDIAIASQIVPADLTRQGLASHEVARVAVVFGVHGGVPVSALTEKQICDVYSGAVTNWQQLGGRDVAIAARTRPAAEVDAAVVLAGVPCFKTATAATAAKVIERPEDMAADLAASAGALGMTSMAFVEQSRGRIKALSLGTAAPSADNVRRGVYPLVRSSFLVTKATPSAAVARFLSFVRGRDGARIIAANGGVPQT
jgi:phosphate transport system substrate-binding protein